jgi:S1-C subfamily serine protease
MVTWNGDAIEGVVPWLLQLGAHEPGDKVQVGVDRGSETIVLWVTLKERASAGG